MSLETLRYSKRCKLLVAGLRLTNVKVYISLKEAGAGERMQRWMVRGGERDKKSRGME